MRVLVTFASFAPIAALAACNPYNPDLGQTPFRCGNSDPVCPSGYSCVAGLCEEDNGDGPDGAPDTPDGGCADLAEPNDMLNMATPTPLFGQDDYVQYEGVTLCPMMDADYFSVYQPVVSPNPDLRALIEFEDLANPPTIAIVGATGNVVAPQGTTGTPGQLKAVLTNVSQGQFYVRVTSQAVLGHYRLTICAPTSVDPPCP